VLKLQKIKNKFFIASIIPLVFLSLFFLSFKPIEISAVTYEKSFIEMYKPMQKDIEKNYYTRNEINTIIAKLDKEKTIQFYNQFVNNKAITITILNAALEKQVPVNIAFSLAWKESRFNPRAISPKNSNKSQDWGLFQLNDFVYKWAKEDFFNIEKNSFTAMDHILFCLRETENMETALASYNAGVYRILTRGTPSSTEKYVIDILEYEDFLNQEFNKFIKRKK